MKPATFKSRAVGYYKSRIAVNLRSGPGWGKSQILQAMGRTLSDTLGGNYAVQILMGPALIPGDTLGYLLPGAVDEQGRATSSFTMPYWWYVKGRDGKLHPLEHFNGGIIVIDEFDKCSPDDAKLWGEGMLSGRVGSHQLPDGWIVWAASNRAKDRSGSRREFDHLINRQHQINLSMDVDGWKEWAFAHGVPAPVIYFAEENSNIVWNDEPPATQGPFCTPRSLVRCAEVLSQFLTSDGNFPTDSDAVEDAEGIIGAAPAAQLFAHLRTANELPKYADIVERPAETKVPSRPDAAMILCYELAAKVDKKAAAAVLKYVQRMPAEFHVLFARSACQRDRTLIAVPAFGEWALKNSVIMQQIDNLR